MKKQLNPKPPAADRKSKAQAVAVVERKDSERKKSLVSLEESRSSLASSFSGVGDRGAGRMKVLIRIRPLNKLERQSKANSTTTVQANDDGKTLQINNADGKITVMSFDRVMGESSDQNVFFENSNVNDLIAQGLKGYATTVFAFGQTGSGKTYTITGPTEDTHGPEVVGLVPRSLDSLFKEVERQKSSKEIVSIRIQASYMEIYNENVLDLLNPQNSGLPVRWSPERGFFVEHLYIVDCDSLDDCLAVLEEGLRNRTTAAHEMNEHSSRSHSILTIYLEVEGVDDDQQPQHRYGKINFVDLAGSEKVKESKTTLDTFAEALSINKSLLTLGKCITALADSKTRGGHIPFRDSKLTKLLADSLSGRGLALMIACISPAFQNLNETLKTVRYAMQARKIRNRPIIQLDPQDEMVANFKMEILLLKKENTKLKLILQKDPKYQDSLKLISEETGEYQKSLKSRPESSISIKPRPIAYRDRLDSSIPSLPEIIKDRSRTKSKAKQPGAHSRSATAISSFGSPVKKALSNALPARLTENRKVQPKSAAKQRIEEMKRSVAPAGHEPLEKRRVRTKTSEERLDPPKEAVSLNHQKSKAVVPLNTHSKKAVKMKTPHEAEKHEKSTARSITPHPTRKIVKRPSAIEHYPKLEAKAFPDHPRSVSSKDANHSRASSKKKSHEKQGQRSRQNSKKKSHEVEVQSHGQRSRQTSKRSDQSVGLNTSTKKKIDTLKEIKEMEEEIQRLKSERKKITPSTKNGVASKRK